MWRLILAFALISSFHLSAFCQEDEMMAIENKKALNTITWGEGEARSMEKAKSLAEMDLYRKFRHVVSITDNNVIANHADGSGVEDFSSSMSRTLLTTIDGLKYITYSTTKKEGRETQKWYCAFVYISNEDKQRSEDRRQAEEREMILNAISQEENLKIAAALKYYNWALTMIKAYGDDDLTIDVKGQNRNAKIWLANKIESVLSNLKFEVDANSMTINENDHEKYSLMVKALYDGNPVSTLDVAYFVNSEEQMVRANDGKLTLHYPSLDKLSDVKLKVQYRYSDEAQVAGGIIGSVYGDTDIRMAHVADFDDIASIKIPFNYNAASAQLAKASAAPMATGNAASEPPLVKPGRQALDMSEFELADNAAYVAKMQAVEKALRTKNYESVKTLFTDEGYRIFDMLTAKSTIKVVGKPEYRVEQSDLFTIGKSIPISVTRKGHGTTESLVFRFERGTNLIKSVAFALTKRAEDDIFRAGADWAIDSRYSILTFMEDYQTAFHTQDVEYIKKIFSNDAIIITGKFTDNPDAQFVEDPFGQRSKHKGKYVVYQKHTKDQYLRHITEVFDANAWTHIDFEENVMSKVPTGGLVDNDVMWIELKQNWQSSRYCDVGFLGLQINLDVAGGQSKINVRTWTPDFVEIEELKERFPAHM